jgi:hypothetical protein
MSVLGMSLRVSAIELLCLTNLLLRGLLENGSRRWCMIGESRNSRTWCGSFSGGRRNRCVCGGGRPGGRGENAVSFSYPYYLFSTTQIALPFSRQLINTPDICCHTGHMSLPGGNPLSVPLGIFCCQLARHSKLTSLIHLAFGSKTGIAQIPVVSRN